MNVRAFLDRLRGGSRRPPSGPLTTDEQATADDVRTQALLEESEESAHEPEHDDPR